MIRAAAGVVVLVAAVAGPLPAVAQTPPLVGQIMCTAWERTPVGWVPADGRLLPIAEYETLFQLIGTTYGGDGETNFAMPDLRGRLVTGTGGGPGLTARIVGTAYGSERHALTADQLPSHAHVVSQPGSTAAADAPSPDGGVPAIVAGAPHYASKNNAPAQLAGNTSAATGGGQPVDRMPPALVIPCFIAWSGVFPQPQ